jgi:hypothetical protein
MGHNSEYLIRVEPSHTRVLACATVMEEMLPVMPSGMKYTVMDFGLHTKPDSLKGMLQKTIDESIPGIDTIILGYGLCSMAVVGLKSADCRLIVPRVDDCIAIFLGSDEAYKQQHQMVPGTYYLTKGWIKAGGTPFKEHDDVVKKYGEEKAKRITQQMLKHYTRLAFINTGPSDLAADHAQAREVACRFNLSYAEIPGSEALVKKMLYGPWDSDFVIVEPGQTISFADFRKA